ncbi:hypothetical protein PIB30_099202 [Stylosanthes scabra]|uniref:Uncharacterized protein n=1 Tax=Stylosanthes scabra TaxID=79078 RepID=A0ABU6RXG5_9FABA|nr:hypothetical protein [Stylosanthes scabra]
MASSQVTMSKSLTFFLLLALFAVAASAQGTVQSPAPSPDAGAAGAVSTSVSALGASVVLSICNHKTKPPSSFFVPIIPPTINHLACSSNHSETTVTTFNHRDYISPPCFSFLDYHYRSTTYNQRQRRDDNSTVKIFFNHRFNITFSSSTTDYHYFNILLPQIIILKPRKNGERKLEEQERRNLEHSVRVTTPRHGDSRLGVQSSSPGSNYPRLGVDTNA